MGIELRREQEGPGNARMDTRVEGPKTLGVLAPPRSLRLKPAAQGSGEAGMTVLGAVGLGVFLGELPVSHPG